MKKVIRISFLALSLAAANAATGALAQESVSATEKTQVHHTRGVVEQVDQKNKRVVLKHERVPSLEWPDMTMGFAVQDEALLEELKVGEEVEFGFIQAEGATYTITEITPID